MPYLSQLKAFSKIVMKIFITRYVTELHSKRPFPFKKNFIALILYLKFRCINMSAICVKAFSVCAVGHEYFLVNATMVTIHA